MMRGLGILVAALALLTAAACGGGDDSKVTPSPSTGESPTAGPTATRPAASPAAATPATAAPSFEGTLGPASGAATGATPVTLRDVRVGTSASFDTIVFQFDGTATSGYSVQYVDRVPSCPAPIATPTSASPAGNPPASATRGRATSTPTARATPTEPPPPTPTPFGTVAGKAMIAVRLEPATTGGGLSRSDFRGGQGALAQATQVCESQDVVAWVLGVAGRRPFRVTVVNNPPRLVIDIQQP